MVDEFQSVQYFESSSSELSDSDMKKKFYDLLFFFVLVIDSVCIIRLVPVLLTVVKPI